MSFLSKRWEFATLLGSGLLIEYTLRVNMSVAIKDIAEDLNWSDSQKGLVLSSFYWGYTIGQIPANLLTQRYGAKWLFGFSVLIPSILTLLVPLACRHSFGLALFIRVMIGLFESPTFPAVYHFFPIWVPISEKTFMIPYINSGMYLGEIIGFSLSGVLASSSFIINGDDYGGWPSVFYVFGTMGIIWFPLWAYIAYDSPSLHPTISKEEILIINRGKSIPLVLQGFTHSLDGNTNNNEDDDKECISPLITSSVDSNSNDKCYSNNKHIHYITIDNHDSNTTTNNNEYQQNPIFNNTNTNNDDTLKDEWNLYQDDHHNKRNSRNQQLVSMYTKQELIDRTPWKQFFTHPVAIALLVAAFGYGWIGFTLLSEMPTYLTDVLGFDLQSAGFLCVFPYLALFIATLSFGKLFDDLQHKYHWSVNSIRRAAQFIAYIGGALGLVICGFIDQKYIAYSFMILTQIFFAAGSAGIGCAWTDIAPVYSSSLNSVGNSVGSFAGILGPLIISALTESFGDDSDPWGWRIAFLLTFGISCFVIIIWFYIVKAEIVPELNNPTPL